LKLGRIQHTLTDIFSFLFLIIYALFEALTAAAECGILLGATRTVQYICAEISEGPAVYILFQTVKMEATVSKEKLETTY
jgi:hypothetical protein